ncbi:MAG: HAMP domain-containing sensor histidine kinase [Actinocatenispora sp.]
MSAPEEQLLVRSRRLLTRQIAAVITGVVLLVGGVDWGLMAYRQHTDGRREVAASLREASVAHPWPCVWMFEQRSGRLHGTPAAPDNLPFRADLGGVTAAHPLTVAEHEVGGVDYLVRTEWHGGRVRQAALDLRYQAEERRRLYLALTVAEVAGLLAALVTGRLLAGRAIRPLGEALRRQRRFVADASHELRTPLTQIHTRAQLMERRLRTGADSATVAGDARRLVANSRAFGDLLDDLLHAAQWGAGGQRRVPVDLGALVNEVVGAETARVRQRGLTLRLDAEHRPFLVSGAAPALRRVVNALVDNAIGHTPHGGHVRVALRLTDDDRTVLLTVTDDGVGLDPAQADRIFERFAHGEHGTGRRFGLGLALVREVLSGHGGSITADGEPGNGATFTVRLPAVEPSPADAGASATTRPVADRI